MMAFLMQVTVINLKSLLVILNSSHRVLQGSVVEFLLVGGELVALYEMRIKALNVVSFLGVSICDLRTYLL